MTSTTKISALDFHDKLIAQHGVKAASGFSQMGRNTRFEIILKCLRDFPDPNLFLLDYGCYDGELFNVMLQVGTKFKQYVGVDVNPKFILWARERWEGRTAKFMLGNALVTEDYTKIIKQNPDVIVASGVLCCKGEKHNFVPLINRLYQCCQQGLIFNVLTADVPKRLMNPRLVQQSKELHRWKLDDIIRVIRLTGCEAWDIHRGYLHNDMTVVLRKRWTHFR